MKLLKYLILFIMLLLIFSCNILPVIYDYTFINNSGYNVTVSPNGQDWNEFILSSGETRVLTINDKDIYLIYSTQYGSIYVVCDTTTPDIIFYNNTLLEIINDSSSDLYSVSWNGTLFGKNGIWNNDLSDYVDGLPAGYGTDTQEVMTGVYNINFTYTYNGILYETVDSIEIREHEQIQFTFDNSTSVVKK